MPLPSERASTSDPSGKRYSTQMSGGFAFGSCGLVSPVGFALSTSNVLRASSQIQPSGSGHSSFQIWTWKRRNKSACVGLVILFLLVIREQPCGGKAAGDDTECGEEHSGVQEVE